MRIIQGPEDLAEGAEWLARACPVMAGVLARVGPLPLRRRPDGFGAILDAIVGQQVSTASAAAIWGRLQAAGMVEEGAVAAAEEEALRALGLSRPKARYALAVARAGVDWAALRDMPDDQVIARLVALPGVGPWTAEIYAMFALGRADVLASGDLALQEAARVAYGLEARPKAAELAEMARAWSPWAAVAARALWAYYRAVNQREGIR
ncbi:DNA-3-methyladenine glycosylase family protein [Stagnihabitans tardus]|uniref:DNA-3-methyladenine glycosylase II n=1 Tax=Stagnihabitans tardus TaxID=2699202 RepID=A0AAE4Y998_9RHOB|nr:DNA-3-methyladenine glycosylase 2 family protein [Stagnihabitans tardus]NBZ86099.1 DNA-3-methyladenine glycosylase 2 family protein [Stagnihabitans tardus]